MGRLSELKELTRVRVLLFLREPEVLFWVFVFPLVLAAVLGFAFRNAGPEPSAVGVLGEGAAADAIAERLEKLDHVEVKRYREREKAERKLRKGSIDVLVTAGEPPQVRLDPQRKGSETARLRVAAALTESPPEMVVKEVKEKGSRYIDFLFPGLLGMNLMGTGMWLIGFTVAELRQKKVLKRMLVTPMRRSSFMLSFLLSRLAFLVMELVALVAIAVWVLDVPFSGGIFEFGVLCVFGAFVFSGLGLFVTSRVKTIQGASGVLNLVMVPMWLGSGVFFPYERFPEAVQPVLAALPLSALNDALRELMLDGEGLVQIAGELGILAAWGIVPFFLGLKVFRWQ